ncbi:MAG: tetratricopeptide repeat protein [Anaerolineae bacterium]
MQPKKLNPADELRALLDSLEERRVKVKGMDSQAALQLLYDLDEMAARLQELEAAGLELLPERGRFESIQHRFQQEAAPLLKALGKATTLATQRPQPLPPAESWWWYLDEWVARQRRHRGRQIALIVAVIILLLGGIYLAFQTVLAPDPQVVARLEAENNALAALDQGDYPAALAAVEQGLRKVPGEASLLLLQGVIREILGDSAGAEQSFRAAQEDMARPLDFYLNRSRLYVRANRLAQAEADARTALELEQNSAGAWLLLGQALEIQGKRAEAIAAYQQAADLASASGENEIFVTARLAVARISGSP